MGNSKSKNKHGLRGKVYGKNVRNVTINEVPKAREEEHEDVELLLLKRTLQRDPQIFVLNNLMMCVQFFRNYEEEIKHVKETLVSSREAELNARLPPQKHVLLPDLLQEHVARNIGFTSMRQTFRPTIEPLQPVRIYTVHDNIDITEQNYLPYYSSVNDSIMYNILLKPTKHHGYVQLQFLEEFGILKNASREDEMDLSSIAEDDDQVYSDGDSVYGPKPRSDLLPSRRREQGGTLKGSKYGHHTRSLPNLHDGEGKIVVSDREHVQTEVDSENGSSILEVKMHRSKRNRSERELYKGEQQRRFEKQSSSRAKKLESVSRSLASSMSSGYRSDNYAMDSDYSSCNPSQNSRFERSSNEEEMDEDCITNAELPKRCFKRVTYTADGKIYDPADEKKQLLNSKQRRIKLALRRHNYDLLYASSTEFMKHFKNVFTYRLANSLGFDRESVEDTKREGCVLYCDKIMVSSSFKHSRVEQYEIIPAVWLQWPSCAEEWMDRSRNTWPDYKDVEKIKDFGCYVVPEGFVPRKGNSNLIEDLEWQLTFPTAERYLETCMTQAQVQVYFITLMLHKTFMRPVFDTIFGLTVAHIRHKLFWMIEENDRPSKWPDNRMGECLLTLLNSLYNNISQNEPTLSDYFIRGRNLFQRVPCDHLLHTQKQLKRIIENPVMFIFHAMENIRYSENFFPRLDYEMLLKILTVDKMTLINPALAGHISKPIVPQPSKDRSAIDEKFVKGGFWDNVKNQEKKYTGQWVTNKTLINPRKATDSIIEISIRCAELEGPRLCATLDFFIRHFIKIAERCNQYGALRQKTVYLDQADRLSILLFEHQRYKNDARAYRDVIKVLRKKNPPGSKTPDDPPKTPKRNPREAAIFAAPLKDRFTRDRPEQVSNSPELTRVVIEQQSRKRSERNVDRVPTLAEPMVRDEPNEAHYEKPDARSSKTPEDETSPSFPKKEQRSASKSTTDEPNEALYEKPDAQSSKTPGDETSPSFPKKEQRSASKSTTDEQPPTILKLADSSKFSSMESTDV